MSIPMQSSSSIACQQGVAEQAPALRECTQAN